LARLCEFGTAMSIKKVFYVFLFMNVISVRLKGTVLPRLCHVARSVIREGYKAIIVAAPRQV